MGARFEKMGGDARQDVGEAQDDILLLEGLVIL